MDKEKLLFEVLKLIDLKQEGEYWDFKREWHKNKTDLLHDIICMANNLTGHDGYIIIGVDEDESYSLADVSNNDNRYNTQKIVDFLSTKKFAGYIKPKVYVETLSIDDTCIDVIVIVSDENVPYYLVERYEGVHQNNIYTRVGDTNTPINRSADLNDIEKLWKRRFGISLSAIEKFKRYLKEPENWAEIEHEEGMYYKYAPEFRIIETPDNTRTAYEYYMFSQIDSRPHWKLINLYYHQTPMKQVICNLLDDGRYFTPAPDWRMIKIKDGRDFFYRSFVKGSLKYLLGNLLFESNSSDAQFSRDRLMSCVLTFNSENERKEFEQYVFENYNRNDVEKYKDDIPCIENIKGYRCEMLRYDYKNALLLMDMLNEFRGKNDQ